MVLISHQSVFESVCVTETHRFSDVYLWNKHSKVTHRVSLSVPLGLQPKPISEAVLPPAARGSEESVQSRAPAVQKPCPHTWENPETEQVEQKEADKTSLKLFFFAFSSVSDKFNTSLNWKRHHF